MSAANTPERLRVKLKFKTYCLPFYLLLVLRMVLTVDEALEHVGGFGFFQKRLNVALGYGGMFVLSFQLMMTIFLTSEPAWQCVSNSTICNITDPMFPGDENYHARCDMPRSEWEFDKEFTSIVTEVITQSCNLVPLKPNEPVI